MGIFIYSIIDILYKRIVLIIVGYNKKPLIKNFEQQFYMSCVQRKDKLSASLS